MWPCQITTLSTEKWLCVTGSALPPALVSWKWNRFARQNKHLPNECELQLLRRSWTEAALEMGIVQEVENVQNINTKFTDVFWGWMTLQVYIQFLLIWKLSFKKKPLDIGQREIWCSRLQRDGRFEEELFCGEDMRLGDGHEFKPNHCCGLKVQCSFLTYLKYRMSVLSPWFHIKT